MQELKGNKIYLRQLGVSDVSNDYVSWLNDEEVNRYLESRYVVHTIESTKSFVKSAFEDPSIILWGMFDLCSQNHIGNIKLGPIDHRYKRATIGLVVGDRKFWGKGIAKEAISLITDYSFNILKLHKVDAGCYASNLASKYAFLKTGFCIEATRKEHYILDDNFEDAIILMKISTSNTDS